MKNWWVVRASCQGSDGVQAEGSVKREHSAPWSQEGKIRFFQHSEENTGCSCTREGLVRMDGGLEWDIFNEGLWGTTKGVGGLVMGLKVVRLA